MKVRTILIISFIFFLTFELINTASSNKNNLSKKTKRFMQDGDDESSPESTPETSKQNGQYLLNLNDIKIPDNICNDVLKPSTAFTVILMIYMVLIIIGGILVLVLLKKDLEK